MSKSNKKKSHAYPYAYDEAMAWAAEQLAGVLAPTHNNYFVEVQAMELVYMDCMCMQLVEEQGVVMLRWPSEWAPYSYAWLL